ncbi:hypothetical protein [Halalkalicoccus salilacus]|uniref:hypothetical protein n=1 Tax=Halalkalicoccus salilacus TaxID=3117459 RepID=UPI00300E8E3B
MSLISIEVEAKREYEYLKDEDQVRIEYDNGRTNEMSFEEWGMREATSAAADHVRRLLTDERLIEESIHVGEGRVDLDDFDEGIDNRTTDESVAAKTADIGVIVSYRRLVSQEGEVIADPTIDFRTVADILPQFVEATVLFDEREHTAVLPVVCKKEEIEQDQA